MMFHFSLFCLYLTPSLLVSKTKLVTYMVASWLIEMLQTPIRWTFICRVTPVSKEVSALGLGIVDR